MAIECVFQNQKVRIAVSKRSRIYIQLHKTRWQDMVLRRIVLVQNLL